MSSRNNLNRYNLKPFNIQEDAIFYEGEISTIGHQRKKSSESIRTEEIQD